MLQRLKKQLGFTLLEMMVVILVINVLIILLLPAVQQAREAARRASCQNNLRQIGIALWNYHDNMRVFPPGTVNQTGPIKSQLDGGYHMSWIVQLLPYVEHSNTYRQIDFNETAYSTKNSAVITDYRLLELLQCPSEASRAADYSSYAASHHHVEAPIDVDNTGVFYLNSSIRLDDLVDGLPNTLLVAEKVTAGASLSWMSGTNATLRNASQLEDLADTFNRYRAMSGRVPPGVNPEQDTTDAASLEVGGWSSAHGSGFQVLLADGSVRFVSSHINLKILSRLAHRNDGEIVSEF